MGDAAAGDGSVATSEEMLLAVERWSRARKIRIGDYPDPARLWEVTMTRSGTVGITKRDGAGRIDPTVGTKDNALQVAPEVAVAWALAVEAGLPAVDVGRCPACVARSLPGRTLATTEWGIATAYGRTKPYIAHARYHPADGWLRGWGGKRRKGSSQWAQHHARPCPDCNGTGRDMREVARLVLDAAPRPIDADVRRIFFGDNPPPTVRLGGCGEEVSTTHEPGDQRARDALTALADHLQPHAFDRREPDPTREAVGHALAHLVALWLDGDLRETRTSVEALTAAWERLTVMDG